MNHMKVYDFVPRIRQIRMKNLHLELLQKHFQVSRPSLMIGFLLFLSRCHTQTLQGLD